jgi:hypothetical protein
MTLIKPNDYAAIKAVDSIEASHASLADLRSIGAPFAADAFHPIPQNCSKEYHALRQSGTRPLDQIWWIVLHDTEGSSAKAAATWFENPKAQGSSNVVVDDNICYQVLEENQIPWGAPGANYHGWHIEQAGFATWSNILWSSTHRNTMRRAAYRAAVRCYKFKIPAKFVKADGLKLGVKGITTHAECTKAFGGNHTDPGSGYPMPVFITMVQYYLNGIK